MGHGALQHHFANAPLLHTSVVVVCCPSSAASQYAMADASIPASQAEGLFELQGAKPLRESVLWQLQSAFYREKAVAAWKLSLVPNFVTSNSFVAACYARIILAYIRDWFLRHPDAKPGQRINIVEVGAGHGKLSFLIVRELLAMRDQWPDPTTPPFRMVVTDFMPGMIEFWSAHECLKPLIDAGLVDLGVFDAEHDREIKLVVSGGRVGPGSGGKCPLIAVANYTFDTLRQDAFRIVEGQLQEAMVTVLSESEADVQLLAAALAAGGKAGKGSLSGSAGDVSGGTAGYRGLGMVISALVNDFSATACWLAPHTHPV